MLESTMESLTEILGEQASASLSLIDKIRKGLPRKSLIRVARIYDVPQSEWATLVGVTTRTMQRWDGKGTCSPQVSDRVLLLADVFARAQDVFGSKDSARKWLKHESTALGGIAPYTLLDTTAGAELVLRELGRIEYGVVA